MTQLLLLLLETERNLKIILNGHSSGHRTERAHQRELARMLEEEKRARNGGAAGGSSGQNPQPVFVPFKHYYFSVEDASGIHRPVILKEFRKDEYPSWPILRKSPKGKSPFLKLTRAVPSGQERPQLQKPQDTEPAKESGIKREAANDLNLQAKRTRIEVEEERRAEENTGVKREADENLDPQAKRARVEREEEPRRAAAVPFTPPFPPTPQSHETPMKPHPNPHPLPLLSPISSRPHPPSPRPSGIHPPTNTVSHNTLLTAVLTSRYASVSGAAAARHNNHNEDVRRLPPGEHVAKLDRRMVEAPVGQQMNDENKSQERKKAAVAEAKRQLLKQKYQEKLLAREKERMLARKKWEQELNFCENCSKRFKDLKEVWIKECYVLLTATC